MLLALLAAVLFFVLTPGIVLRLPRGGSPRTVAAVHAVVYFFAFLFLKMFMMRYIWRRNRALWENFDNASTKTSENKEGLKPKDKVYGSNGN